jgi:hypothetical protein
MAVFRAERLCPVVWKRTELISFLNKRLQMLRAHQSAGTFLPMLCQAPAEALVTLKNESGEDFTAYEMEFGLEIVALQNTINAQEILDFKRTYGKYCGLKVGFRSNVLVRTVLYDVPTSSPASSIYRIYIN